MTTPVEGLDRLERQLRALPDLVTQEVAAEIQVQALALADAIKDAAPRSSKAHQHMADGIKAVEGGKGRASPLAWRVICPAPGRWVEFGTKAHDAGDYHQSGGTDTGHLRHAGGGHHATRRHPFFWPLVRAWKSRIKSSVSRAAGRAIRSVAKAA